MSDNAVVVACLKEQGGTVSRVMCSLAQKIMDWTELRSMTLSARYIPRKNILADQLNCPDQVLPTEWSLLPGYSMPYAKCFGCSHMDLFATRANAKLPLYVSLGLDPMVWKQGAFQHTWNYLGAYASPPPSSKTVLLRVMFSANFSLVPVTPL